MSRSVRRFACKKSASPYLCGVAARWVRPLVIFSSTRAANGWIVATVDSCFPRRFSRGISLFKLPRARRKPLVPLLRTLGCGVANDKKGEN
eukprot:9293290-Lingulodinium_polyedra.AAC.1